MSSSAFVTKGAAAGAATIFPKAINVGAAGNTLTIVVTIWNKKDLRREQKGKFHTRITSQSWVLKVVAP